MCEGCKGCERGVKGCKRVLVGIRGVKGCVTWWPGKAVR